MTSPYRAARDVIETHLLDAEGMLGIPIDPFQLAARLGITVSLGDLDTGTAGLIIKNAGDNAPRIFLNRSDTPNRRKFTLAHELGHYFRHQEAGDHEYGYVDERADLAGRGEDADEVWANRFAAELLMPAFVVRKFFGDGYSTTKLAKELAVSELAMGYRLRNLSLA